MSNGIRDTVRRGRRYLHSDIDDLIHPGAINLFLSMCSRGQSKKDRSFKRRPLRIAKVISMRRINVRTMRTRSASGFIARGKANDEKRCTQNDGIFNSATRHKEIHLVRPKGQATRIGIHAAPGRRPEEE